ncbi:MAG: dephospho-CoA kinase [Myxococcales bacterium]|nr:dephospho-CoA kinase [Myxococcales bacterium]
MMIIGLTGSFASGKSTVAEFLIKAHVPVIDADELARSVCSPGSMCLKKIVSTFGPNILNANLSLNRKALASIVFNDQEQLEKLEAIVHPAVHQLFLEELKKHKAHKESVVVYMAPLLFEKNLELHFDKIILITAPQQKMIKRAMVRDDISYEEAKRRLERQMPNSEKIMKADEIIDNSGTKDDLYLKIKKI